MLATDSEKHSLFKSSLPHSSRLTSNDTRTPDLAADLELSFIDNNSFILSPHHPSLQSPTIAMMKKKSNITNSTITKFIKTPALQKPAIPTLKEQDKMIDEASREIFSLKMKIFYLEERIKKMTPKHMEEALNENVELNVKNEALSKDVAILKAHLQTAEQALNQIELQKAEQQQSYQKQLSAQEDKLEQQNARLNAFQAEWENLEKERDEWKSKATESQSHLQSTIDNINRQHEQAISRYQDQIDQKEAFLEQKQFEFQSKIHEYAQKCEFQSHSQDNDTKADHDILVKELENTKAEYSSLKNKYDAIENEYDNMKSSYTDIKRQFEQSFTKNTNDMQLKLKDNMELKRISDRLEQEKKQRELVTMESQKLQMKLTGMESEYQMLLHKMEITSTQFQKTLQEEQLLRSQLSSEVNKYKKREEELSRQLENLKFTTEQVATNNANQHLEEDLNSMLELVQDTIMKEHSFKFSNLIQQLHKTSEGDKTTLLIQILKRILRYFVMRIHDLQMKVDDYHVLYDELGKLVTNWPLPLILSNEDQKDDNHDRWMDEYSIAIHMPSLLSRLKYIQGIYHMQLDNLYSFMKKLDRYIYEELLGDKNVQDQSANTNITVKHPTFGPMIPLISSIMFLQAHIMDGISRLSSINKDNKNETQFKQIIERKEKEMHILSTKYYQLEKDHDIQKEELVKRERIIAKALKRLEKINTRREAISEQLKLSSHQYN